MIVSDLLIVYTVCSFYFYYLSTAENFWYFYN